jgi:hypothetical protein
MTVKQLKEHLNKFPEDLKVMISHYDHTDFLYKVNLRKKDVKLDDPLSDDSWGEVDGVKDKWFDEEYNYIGPKVVVFNLDLEN